MKIEKTFVDYLIEGKSCAFICSPLFTYTLELKKIEEENGKRLFQKIRKDGVYTIQKIITFKGPDKGFTLEYLKKRAKMTLMFGFENTKPQRTRIVNNLFNPLEKFHGFSKDSILEFEGQTRCVLDGMGSFQELNHFFKNVFRIGELWIIGNKIGYDFAIEMTNEELGIFQKANSEAILKILRTILFTRRKIDSKNPIFLDISENVKEHFIRKLNLEDPNSLTNEDELNIIFQAYHILRLVYQGELEEKNSCLIKNLGNEKDEISSMVFDELLKYPDLIDIQKDWSFLDSQKVFLKSFRMKEEENIFIGEVIQKEFLEKMILGHVSNISMGENSQDPYFSFLRKLQNTTTNRISFSELISKSNEERKILTQKKTNNVQIPIETMFIFTKRNRIPFLKDHLGIESIHDFSMICPLLPNSLDLPINGVVNQNMIPLEIIFSKHISSKTKVNIILENSHTFSQNQLSFFFILMKFFEKKYSIIQHIYLFGNKYCFSESHGKPFFDLLIAFQTIISTNPEFTSIQRMLDFDSISNNIRKPSYFNSIEEFIDYLKKLKIHPSITIICGNKKDVYFLENSSQIKENSSFLQDFDIQFKSIDSIHYYDSPSAIFIVNLFSKNIYSDDLYKIISLAPKDSQFGSGFFAIGSSDHFDQIISRKKNARSSNLDCLITQKLIEKWF